MRTSLPPLQRKHYLGGLFLQSIRFTLNGTAELDPLLQGNVFAIECPPREIHQLPTSPKFIRPSTAAITRKRQQPWEGGLPPRAIENNADLLLKFSASCGDGVAPATAAWPLTWFPDEMRGPLVLYSAPNR